MPLPSLTKTVTVFATVVATLAATMGPASALPTPADVTTTAIAVPAIPTGLPKAIEPLSGYVPQTACDPVMRPGAKKFGDMLRATYAGTSYAVTRPCGGDGGTSPSEHYEGRAVDYFINAYDKKQKKEADALLKWLLATDEDGNKYAMARRLGIMYIIWHKKIFGLYRPQDGWRNYSCSGVTACHSDHIHFSMTWAGVMGRTSFWTKKSAPTDFGPCREDGLNWAAPYEKINKKGCASTGRTGTPKKASSALKRLIPFSGAHVQQGSTGPVVSALQNALGLKADGAYGKATTKRVKDFQRENGVTVTGKVDTTTWRALLTALAPKKKSTTEKPSVTAPAEPKTSPLTKYKKVKLRKGDRGAAVKALQRALGLKATGVYDAKMKKAVKKFKKKNGLGGTGYIGKGVWKALGA